MRDRGYYRGLTIVAISARRPLAAPVTLEGWDCASGQRLRFWYGHPDNPFSSLPVSAAQLARTGDLVATLRPSRRTGYPGYMLFTHPGRWKVAVFQGNRQSGEVVFQVGASSRASVSGRPAVTASSRAYAAARGSMEGRSSNTPSRTSTMRR